MYKKSFIFLIILSAILIILYINEKPPKLTVKGDLYFKLQDLKEIKIEGALRNKVIAAINGQLLSSEKGNFNGERIIYTDVLRFDDKFLEIEFASRGTMIDEWGTRNWIFDRSLILELRKQYPPEDLNKFYKKWEPNYSSELGNQ